MKIKKIFKAIAAVLCAGILTGCSNSGSGDNLESASPYEETQTSSVGESEVSQDTSNQASDNTASASAVKITALSGPTAMGMTKLMEDCENDDNSYEFSILSAVDEISPKVIKGDTDIFCVPANLASVIYNKTEGGIKVLAVNTLGVIYICENGNTITNVSDLKGKTIYASGKNATPEYALNYILAQNGLDPEKDVTIEWKSEHAECAAALLADENGAAMLPQPFVASVQAQNSGINIALDLTQEWNRLDNGSEMITGVVAVRTAFAEKNPDIVDEFLTRYAASVEYVNANVGEAAALVEKYGIIKAAAAEKAIPLCNIVCITSDEMKAILSGYLKVLFEQNPQAVGGAEPKDDFYYGA